jgi:uncharacterized protein (TIGR03435 family)
VTLSGSRFLAAAGALAGLLLPCALRAQSPAGFEAVSIRRNLSGSPNTQIEISGGRLRVTNGSLKTLIRNAYDILAFQLAGEPRWMDGEMYDIVATTGSSEKISTPQFRTLLRSLLADRFRLKVHWETRETSVYALVLDKNGSKLQEDSGTVEPGINTQKTPGRVLMRGTRELISILAGNLGNQLGRIVLDRTGLQGTYDWSLEWDPDPAPDSTRPPLFTALPEQLGLRLESQKGPMEVLVIDRAERPSEN